MSKIVAFIGSPRKNGFSTLLLEQVLAGARSTGAEVVTYDLNEEGIRGCQGCLYCRTHEGCATQDKLQPMYKDILEAEGIAASFPIYFGNITGQAKQWLDRMYPMENADFSPRYPGKRVVTVYAQGNANPEMFKNTFELNDMFFRMFGWDVLSRLVVYGSSAPDYKLPPELMEEAFKAGKKLAG